jgi:hypothetical protein
MGDKYPKKRKRILTTPHQENKSAGLATALQLANARWLEKLHEIAQFQVWFYRLRFPIAVAKYFGWV